MGRRPSPPVDEGSEDENAYGVRAPRVFDNSDDEPEGIVGDDEEIDSDEAFGEDDEYELGQTVFRAHASTSQEEDEDDAPHDFEEDDGDDLVALSHLLDEAPDEDEDTEEDNESENDDTLPWDDDDLARFASKKRAYTDDEPTSNKRVSREERTEAVQEGSDAAGGGAKLSLQDFLSTGAGTSLQKVRALAERASATSQQPVASKRGGGMLHAPLPKTAQDRLDRAAAYTLSKEEVQGWAPTIKRLREAEHLSFPLQKPAQPPQASNAGLTATFQPSTEMEQSVAALLEEGGLTEKQVAEQEGLAMRAMDAAEASRRQAELRRMRELMFRAEQKARRANKIKSKTYRRIHRKERERMQQQLADLAAADGTIDDKDQDEMIYQAAKDRAKERATLRHKNTGKWAKSHLGRHDEASQEARLAMEDQLRRGEELRKRIHSMHSDEDDSFDEEYDEDNAEDRQARAFDELEEYERREALQDAKDEADIAASDKKGKGVFQMKFMKDARERQARVAKETIASLMEDVGRMDASDEEEALPTSVGRAVYGPGLSASRTSDVASRPANPFSTGETNPWLQGEASSSLSKKKPSVLVGKDSSAATKAAHRTERHTARGDEARASALSDATLAIDPTAQLAMAAEEASEEEESDVEPADVTALARTKRGKRGKKGGSAMAPMKRDLVAEAFAGDNVALDFAKEKRAAMEADAPRDEDMTLPGWGSWGGKGVRRKAKKTPTHVRHIAGLDPHKRKDFGMDNVILNERLDKKASRYKAKDLPFPYTSAAQYEAAMRTPLGAEWNTRTQHQRMTLPRVTTKMGQRIDPIRTYAGD